MIALVVSLPMQSVSTFHAGGILANSLYLNMPDVSASKTVNYTVTTEDGNPVKGATITTDNNKANIGENSIMFPSNGVYTVTAQVEGMIYSKNIFIGTEKYYTVDCNLPLLITYKDPTKNVITYNSIIPITNDNIEKVYLLRGNAKAEIASGVGDNLIFSNCIVDGYTIRFN